MDRVAPWTLRIIEQGEPGAIYGSLRFNRVENVDETAAGESEAVISGYHPEELEIRIGDSVAFSGPAWRYPDFLGRAEVEHQLLHQGDGW